MSEANNEECDVCFKQFDKEHDTYRVTYITLRCGHSFCKECFDQFERMVCPSCAEDVDVLPALVESDTEEDKVTCDDSNVDEMYETFIKITQEYCKDNITSFLQNKDETVLNGQRKAMDTMLKQGYNVNTLMSMYISKSDWSRNK